MLKPAPFAILHLSHTWPINTEPECSWAIYRKPGQAVLASGQGTLKQAALACKNSKLILALPIMAVSLFAFTVPSNNARNIRAALPYLLKSQLAGPIEEEHICWQKGAKIQGACINRAQFQDLLDLLCQYHLVPLWATVDALLLPWQPASWTVYETQNNVLIRYAPYGAIVTTDATLEPWLKLIPKQHQLDRLSTDTTQPYISLLTPVSDALHQQLKNQPIPLQSEAQPNAQNCFAALLAPQFDPKICLNLMSGLAKSRTRIRSSQWIKHWRWPLGLLTSLMLTLAGLLFYVNKQLSWQILALQEQQAQTYLQVFTDEQLVTSPLIQINQKIDQLAVVPASQSMIPLLNVLPYHPQLDIGGAHSIQVMAFEPGKLTQTLSSQQPFYKSNIVLQNIQIDIQPIETESDTYGALVTVLAQEPI